MIRSVAWLSTFGLGALLLAGCGGSQCEPEPEGSIGLPTAWEAAFLREGRLPAPATRAFLTGEDGLQLAYSDYVPAGWDGTGRVVVLVHGSSAHGRVYAALGVGLQARGVYSRLIDLRGHGYSRCVSPSSCEPGATPDYVDDGAYWPGRPGDSADPLQHSRDLHAHLEDLRARFPSAPQFLAGHSSGAGLVARYVESVGMSALKGAVLLAPFLHSQQPQNELSSWECGSVVGTSYARVDLGAVGDAQRGNAHRYVLRLEKGEAYADALETVRYTWTTMTGLATHGPDSFHASFTGPTLWVTGDQDALLDLERSRSEYERMPGGAGFVTVRDTSHVGVSWSDKVAGLVADFTAEPGAPLPVTIEPI